MKTKHPNGAGTVFSQISTQNQIFKSAPNHQYLTLQNSNPKFLTAKLIKSAKHLRFQSNSTWRSHFPSSIQISHHTSHSNTHCFLSLRLTRRPQSLRQAQWLLSLWPRNALRLRAPRRRGGRWRPWPRSSSWRLRSAPCSEISPTLQTSSFWPQKTPIPILR